MQTTQNPPRSIETIARIERLKNTINGNPRFRFHFDDGTSALLTSDAGFGYEVGNPGFREGCTVEVTWTRAGRVSFMRRYADPMVCGGTGQHDDQPVDDCDECNPDAYPGD